jgi:UDP-N-acetylmuramate dehydrogenase
MEIKQNISLKSYNTFGIDVKAKKFVTINSIENLRNILSNNKEEILVIGGGSNILFTQDFSGLVINNKLKGIEVVEEDNDYIYLKVAAGEVWHEFVLHCVEKGFAGIENLSLIPGSVGAAPMQNIGAYGVEVKDVITKVEALSLSDFSIQTFVNEQCEFGYRTSIFKTSQKNNYFITAVTFRLNKKPFLNTSYGAIENELKRMNIESPSIKDVSDAVISIRYSKLPDPNEIGNSGSFFKNPVVSEKIKNKILTNYASAPCYAQPNGDYKLAAGWLIEQCGWKGKKIENYGVHKNQALVLVNYGGASGKDILNLSEEIIKSVEQRFGILLEREVNII